MESVTVHTPVITATFTLTRADVVWGFLGHSRRLIRWFSGTAGWLGVLALIGELMPPPESAPPSSIAPAVVLMAVACVFPLLLAGIRAIEFSGKRSSAMTYAFFPDRIEHRSTTATTEIPWTAIVRVRESESGFLFYPQRASFFIVPRRALGDGSAQQAFRNLILQSLGSGKAKVLHESAFSPSVRTWNRTICGLGYGVVLLVFGLVLQSRHGTFIPAAASSAPAGVLDPSLALICTPLIWGVLAGFAGSEKSRALAFGFLSLHVVTALWLVTRSPMADWDQFRRALNETPQGVMTWIGLYVIGQAVLWWRAVTTGHVGR